MQGVYELRFLLRWKQNWGFITPYENCHYGALRKIETLHHDFATDYSS